MVLTKAGAANRQIIIDLVEEIARLQTDVSITESITEILRTATVPAHADASAAEICCVVRAASTSSLTSTEIVWDDVLADISEMEEG